MKESILRSKIAQFLYFCDIDRSERKASVNFTIKNATVTYVFDIDRSERETSVNSTIKNTTVIYFGDKEEELKIYLNMTKSFDIKI